MKVVILEDEPLAVERLKRLLKEVMPEAEIIQEMSSVAEAIEWFEEHDHPDLLFSDIEVADGVSFEFFKQVELHCPVIFITAYDQYAIQAFEVHSIDYLLKPLTKKRLGLALEKWKEAQKIYGDETAAKLQELMVSITEPQNTSKSRFIVKSGSKIKSIKVEEIAYFFTEDKVSFLRTKEGNKYPVDYRLEELNTLLDHDLFFRINRKYIIHIDALQEIHTYFKGRLKLELLPVVEEDIVVSAERTPLFKEWLDR
ncbi:LytTR family DNA-binding domain-containing protein [Algivirga pacifica]|uniref:LytTR family DNA-binding domain-containing protein n=1 Tax=Algivirga pacifica TaxID=1162670 RepID=A0ABP9DMC2_9BACT